MAPRRESSFDTLPVAGKVLILIVLLAVVFALFYVSIYGSLSDDLTSAKQEHQRLQTQLQTASQRQQRYLEITQELASREALDRQNKRILPISPEIPAFLADINRISELSGVSLMQIEPKPTETAKLYTRAPVSVKANAAFFQLAKLTYNMSRVDRVVSLENIKIDKPSVGANGEVTLDTSFLATTFFRPEPTGSAAQPKTAGGK
ncbi:MAG: type 4a pilus biogenesis protein PilO [Myxococcales bacterium]|nr:type 4a pilus biogenesis protein PilO [Myxococcales bacterium]